MPSPSAHSTQPPTPRRPARALPLALLLLLGLTAITPLGCASDPARDRTAPAADPIASAANPASPTLREAMQAGSVAADPPFWQVAGDGGATLHLLGSIHFGPPHGWRMPDAVEVAFARSTALVVEADDRDIDQAQMQTIMMRHALAPPGSTLADLVPGKTLRDLDAFMATRGQGVTTLLPFRPWMVATVVTMGTVAELGFSPETGVDHDLLYRAGDREVIALETIDSQLAIFGDLSPELDALFLRDTLDQLGEAGQMLLDMTEAWRTNDEPELVRVMSASFEMGGEFETLHDELIVERNQAMAKQLAALARDTGRAGDEIFVVVGAAHFVGEQNIRDLLTARYGLSVTATDPTPTASEEHDAR